MFNFIKDSKQQVTDRNVCELYLCEENQHTQDRAHSSFIISFNGTLNTKGNTVGGSFTARINDEFTYTGTGLIINTPGNRFENDKIAVLNNTGVQGDLSYIDGCSNSNLINPARSGDPCVNYLYFPPGIDQTFHTHPSYRIGYIFGGKGEAHIKTKNGIEVIPLNAGDAFNLERHTLHRFCTKDEPMWLVVFHPDSEDGPMDEHNPMKTRTYLK